MRTRGIRKRYEQREEGASEAAGPEIRAFILTRVKKSCWSGKPGLIPNRTGIFTRNRTLGANRLFISENGRQSGTRI